MLVYVGIPVLDGKPYAALVDSLLAEQFRGLREGVHFLVDWEIGCSLIGHARNKLAKRFLDTKEADCIVFVDADLSWKAPALAALAGRPEPVIGGTYRQKSEGVKFHVRGPVEKLGELYSVGGLPGGFVKIERLALEALDVPSYEDGAGNVLRDFFPGGIHGDTYYGEDYGFCRLWREAGGTVWLDPSIKLKHHDGCQYFAGDPAEWLGRLHGGTVDRLRLGSRQALFDGRNAGVEEAHDPGHQPRPQAGRGVGPDEASAAVRRQ